MNTPIGTDKMGFARHVTNRDTFLGGDESAKLPFSQTPARRAADRQA